MLAGSHVIISAAVPHAPLPLAVYYLVAVTQLSRVDLARFLDEPLSPICLLSWCVVSGIAGAIMACLWPARTLRTAALAISALLLAAPLAVLIGSMWPDVQAVTIVTSIPFLVVVGLIARSVAGVARERDQTS
jgi:hypothetical protein